MSGIFPFPIACALSSVLPGSFQEITKIKKNTEKKLLLSFPGNLRVIILSKVPIAC